MAYKPSKTRQETAIGEGLAVGCMSLGVDVIPKNKLSIEFAFDHAWRRWEHRGNFPSIRASLERNDIMRILHDSAGRRYAFAAEWSTTGRSFEAYPRQEWPLDELGESAGSEFGVTLEGWESLAAPFLDHMSLRSQG